MSVSRRRIMSVTLLALILGLAGLLPAACGKRTTGPAIPYLTGQVLDAAGHAVVSAPVALVFLPQAAATPPANPCEVEPTTRRYFNAYPNPMAAPSVQFHFTIANNGHIVLEIRDRAGVHRRALADVMLAAGVHAVTWDGRDDSGALLPNELYVARWTDTEGDSTFTDCSHILLDVVDGSLAVQAPAAVTDAGGRFAIPLAALPIGGGGLGSDMMGNVTGWFEVTPMVHVCSAASAASGAATACVTDVDLGDRTKTVRVTIRLP